MGTGNMEFDNVQLDVEFSQASERDNITSRENIALSFGKLSTWFEALVPEGGSSGQILGWKSSGKAEWINSPASMDEKVKVDKFVSTTQTDYLLTGAVASMATTAGHLVVDNADGVAAARMRLQKGTTDTIGQSMIILGNNIPSGTSKNMQGMILMYSSSDKYGKIVSESLTDNRTWTLPDKSGTIAMTSDIAPVNNGKLTIKGGTTSVAEFTANQSEDTNFSIVAGSNVTVTPDATNSKITIASSDTKVTSVGNHYTPSRDTSADKTASASGATAAWSIDVVKGVTLQTDGKGHVTGLSVTSGKIPANPNTDTKVTSADNHYAPATVSGQDKSASASGATAAWSIDVVKGVTLNTDGKGHVTGISVTSGKIPANPNTDRYVNSAAFADDSANKAASPVKMTLTRAGSDSVTIVGNIPKVSSSSAGVAPKGAAVSTQSQSTKFLREDGSWAVPSYTSIPSNNVTGSGTSGYLTKWNGTNTITNGPKLGSSTTTFLRNDGTWATPTDTNTTYTLGTSGNNVTLTPSPSGSVQSITVPYATNAAAATTATYANELNMKTLTADTLDTTPGSYAFKGNNLLGNTFDWVGLQVDASNDRFQIIANDQLMFRQNDNTAITDSWKSWLGCLTPAYVVGSSGITVTQNDITIGSGDSAFKYKGSVTISHSNSITASTSTVFKKFSYDANGHITGTANVTASDLPSHTHGLLHSDLNQAVTNGTTGGWSVIGIDPAVNGYVLKSIRINETSPNWLSGDFGAGIAFGGSDTKGVISMRWDSPVITFAGGNHKSTITSPKWYFKISGTSGSTYNLANFYDSATSRTANTVLAAPNGSAGAATFRKLVAADLPSHTHNYAGSSSAGGAATSANKLNTNAGATDRPVYFSGGVPVQCNTPDTGSWFEGVPLIKTDGVMEIGKYIDFHKSNDSTADYDLRLQYTGTATGKTVTLPGASGYVALLAKGGTSYYGMLDGDGATSGWIRTTTNGLLPVQSGNAGSGHSSLGTSSWYFLAAYIDDIHGTLDGTASAWTTARTLTLSGQLTGSVSVKGDANMTLSGWLKKSLIYDETSDFASYAWHKFAEKTITNAHEDQTITFIVSKTWGIVPRCSGILTAHIRTGSTKIYEGSHFYWQLANVDIDPEDFVFVYTNTADTSCKVELWYKQTSRYDGWIFTVLKEHSRTSNNNVWTLYTYAGHGSASHTTGTASYASSVTGIKNNTSGTSSNVTGTVAIAHGGTGATDRLNALKALTNENVGTDAQYFLTITTSWGKGGYTSVANAKTVLGLKSAAYTESSDYSKVSISRSLTSGTKIGTITIDGTPTDLYCQTNTNTDTKVKVTSSTSKAYLIGTTTSPDGTAVEGVGNTGIYMTDGTLTASSIRGSGTESQSTAPTGGYRIYDCRSVNVSPNDGDKAANFYFHMTDMPNTSLWWSVLHMRGWTGAYAAWEIAGPSDSKDQRTTPLYVRTSNTNTAWGSWRKIYDTSNPPTASEVGALATTTKYAASSSVGGPALSVSTAGGDVVLGTPSSSSDDSGDIYWKYGNGQEKARLWQDNTYTAKAGPAYRIYKSDGTALYNGRLPLADGTSASGTWGISITGNAATATTAAKVANAGVGSSWWNDRDNAVIRITTADSSYRPLWSLLTSTTGSWAVGNHNNDNLVFNFISKATYDSGSNPASNAYKQVIFTNEGGITTTGAITASGTGTFKTADFGTQLIVERSGNPYFAALAFKNSLGMLGYIGANAVDSNLYHIYASDTSKQYIILDTGNTSVTTSGSGNAITALSFSNGTFTATKGSTFSLSDHTHNYAGSSSAGGPATYVALPRVTADAKSFPGANKVEFKEYSNTSTNTPSSAWYHIISMEGNDSKYGTQLALGMTANGVYYRNYNNQTWLDWMPLGRFTTTPASGQVVITDGTIGGIKSSGYTIAKSVPSNAVFTDANVTQTPTDSSYTNYRPLLIGASGSSSAGFTPALTTSGTYVAAGIYCQPSSGYLYASEFITSSYTSGTGAKLAPYGLYLKSYKKASLPAGGDYSYSRAAVRVYDGKSGDSSGMVLTVDSGGLTIVGGGESASALAALITDDQRDANTSRTRLNVGGTLNTAYHGSSEQLILSSDNNIYFLTACNTITGRKPVCLDTSSYFHPGTNNTGSIGTTSYYWASAYIGNMHGTNIYTGKASSATGTLTFYTAGSSGSATLKATSQTSNGTYLLPACGNGTYTLSIGMMQVGGTGDSLVMSNVSGIPAGTLSFKIIFKSNATSPMYSMVEIPYIGDGVDCGGLIQVGDYSDGTQGSPRIVMKGVVIRVTAGSKTGTKTFTATVTPTQKISGSSVSEYTRNVIMYKIYACT